ncbi:MAG: S8 family serine peptidase [Clostridiales bacterium]|nr:S8 family serine peptidase [Clostridiales bacterium]
MRKQRWTSLLALLLLLSFSASPAAGAGLSGVEELVPERGARSLSTPAMTEDSLGLWFVELQGAPKIKGGSAALLRQQEKDFRQAAEQKGVKIRYRYESLWNGFSVAASPGHLDELREIPGVVAVYPVLPVTIPQPEEVSPQLYTALDMTGASIAHQMGYTGRGIKVGVIDTGVDYLHPDLGGGFGPGYRVAYGWDFVGDAFDGSNQPVPGPDPMDCNGHGTHVAGIIGANGQVVGVAPEVIFGAYKVFGCEGSTTSDIILAALERAYQDGMQVINMSLGAAFQWPQYPTAVAADRLVEAGVVVVASIGNNGANGVYSAGAPGVGSKVIGVASFDNIGIALNQFILDPGGEKIGYSPASAAPLPPTSGSLPIAATGTPASGADACQALPAGSLTGKAALIRRGGCTFWQKAYNAQQAGAEAVIIYNNVPGRFSATVAGNPPITIPVAAISDTEGLLIYQKLQEGPVSLVWTDEKGTFPTPTGGLVSSFSSYGPAPDFSFKPDLGAPGGLIFATYPRAKGGYATLSGTSMSSPHVAGAAALLLQAHPGISPEEVATRLSNTADPRPWWGNPNLGFLDNVHRQGAGLIQIPRAILTTVTVEPRKIALGPTGGEPVKVKLTLKGQGNATITYTLSHEPALSTGPNPFSPQFLTGFADVTFAKDTVTLKGRGPVSVQVTITPNPALPDGSVYGGYLVFTGDDGSVLRVPYMGYKGDTRQMTLLQPNPYGLPWLAQLQGGSYAPVDDGAVFDVGRGIFRTSSSTCGWRPLRQGGREAGGRRGPDGHHPSHPIRSAEQLPHRLLRPLLGRLPPPGEERQVAPGPRRGLLPGAHRRKAPPERHGRGQGGSLDVACLPHHLEPAVSSSSRSKGPRQGALFLLARR